MAAARPRTVPTTRARHRIIQHDTEPNATAGLHHAAGLIPIGES